MTLDANALEALWRAGNSLLSVTALGFGLAAYFDHRLRWRDYLQREDGRRRLQGDRGKDPYPVR